MKQLSDRLEREEQILDDTSYFFQEIPLIVKRIVESNHKKKSFDFANLHRIPSREGIIRIINKSRNIIFPGYFSLDTLKHYPFEIALGLEMKELIKHLMEQLVLSFQQACLCKERPCRECYEKSRETAMSYIWFIPELSEVLTTDIRAALLGDPAAKSTDEIISCYPGLFAITVYRMAHFLYGLSVPLLPRMMTEYAHCLTGIDIHPGAKIGNSFFIDHGTGVVVGETTEIGDRVRLYQGVTLGALSLPKDAAARYRDRKRHPTIEDDVIIYSNATILGEKAVIGARSIIGGNVWITDKVPSDTKVLLKRPELMIIGNHRQSV